MAGLKYLGPVPVLDSELSYRDYTGTVLDSGFTSGEVDAALNTLYSGYANKSYADTRDALLATEDYIDGQDALRLRLSQRDTTSGIAGLDASGRVLANKINVASTQRWPHGPWSPSAYHGAPLSNVTAETTVYSTTITDPGFAYKVLVFGLLETSMDTDAQYTKVLVRDGSISGAVVAAGGGLADNYATNITGHTDDFEYTANELNSSDWAFSNHPGSTAGGGTIAADGHNAYFRQIVNPPNIIRRAKRIGTDAVTPSDSQTITAVVSAVPSSTNNAVNDFFLRVNHADFARYVRLSIAGTSARWYVNAGFGETDSGFSAPMTFAVGDVWTIIAGAGGTARQFDFLKNGTSVVSWLDGFASSPLGTTNRDWAFGLGSSANGVTPAKLDYIQIGALSTVPNYGWVRIIPQNLHTQSSRTGTTTLFVRAARSGSTGASAVTILMPKLHIMAVPA